MSNAAHRRTREVPAGRIVAAVAAILALFGVLMLVASLTSPASAGTVGYLSPAVSAPKAMHVLTWGFSHVHGTRHLFRYYLNHGALAFLRSGVTSGSGGKGYLWWLTAHHVAPVDW